MQKFKIIILMISLLAVSACKDLDYVPEYNLATNNFYQTEADLEAAVMGAYKDFTYHICMNHYFYQFLMGDDLSTRPNKDSNYTPYTERHGTNRENHGRISPKLRSVFLLKIIPTDQNAVIQPN